MKTKKPAKMWHLYPKERWSWNEKENRHVRKSSKVYKYGDSFCNCCGASFAKWYDKNEEPDSGYGIKVYPELVGEDKKVRNIITKHLKTKSGDITIVVRT